MTMKNELAAVKSRRYVIVRRCFATPTCSARVYTSWNTDSRCLGYSRRTISYRYAHTMNAYNKSRKITKICTVMPRGFVTECMLQKTFCSIVTLSDFHDWIIVWHGSTIVYMFKINISYQEEVGSLMFLAVVWRPDIAFTIGSVRKFLKNHNLEHWRAVNRMFSYLRWALDYGTKYEGSEGELELTRFSDADYASDIDSSIDYGICV